MRWAYILGAMLTAADSGAAGARVAAPPPLYDPVLLNRGLVCRWEARCMGKQEDAMKRALKYVRKKNPPSWRVALCNRNASRKGNRVDWIGFDHCIRNDALRPPPPIAPVRKRRTQILAERGA